MRSISASLLATFVLICSLLPNSQATEACGQYQSFTSLGSKYTFSTDAWGADGDGHSCISVGNDDGFNATWNWWKNSQSVHSYPNVQLNSDLLPMELAYLSSLQVRADWTMNSTQDLYFARDHPASWRQESNQDDIAADVALDLFLDPNPQRANVTKLPIYELMIWFSAVPGVAPIGWSKSNPQAHSYVLDNTTFHLSSGSNNRGQTTYTWLPTTNLTSFDLDLSPLIHYLWRHNLIPISTYLGIVQFGTETFHSAANVTFQVHNFDMAVTRNLTQVLPTKDPNLGMRCLGFGPRWYVGAALGLMVYALAEGPGLW